VANLIEELIKLCNDVGGKIETQQDLYTCRLPEKKKARISFGYFFMFRGIAIEIDNKVAGFSNKRGKWEFRIQNDNGIWMVSSGTASIESYITGYSFRVLRENNRNIAEIKLI
jgi:hypothetical protein